ncbi:MAG: hypothetical protein VX278_23195 [Myxococcota bacterium]|nr:hypothetical protein [Myxococcota bacterium]
MIALMLVFGCMSDRDTLDGFWAGDATCDGRDYEVEIAINEQQNFRYTGQLLFRYREPVSGGEFLANLLYDFSVVQSAVAGQQEVIFYNVVWSDLGCKTVYNDGTEQGGGCQASGLDLSDLEEEIGDLKLDFNGIDRLVIDDGNCQGAFYRE